MKYLSVYITTKNKQEAQKIGEELVRMQLAACVNIIENVESIYRWNGKLHKTPEIVLIAKTKESAVSKLIEKVKSLHSYENPAIVVWSIVDGNKEFLDWIGKEVI